MEVRAASWTVLALGAACLASCGAPNALPSVKHASLGQALQFRVLDRDGQAVSIPKGGRATVVDYWATDCAPCKRKLPLLAAKSPAWRRRGVGFYAIGAVRDDEPKNDVVSTLRSWRYYGEYYIDREARELRAAGFQQVPQTLVFNDKGKLVWIAPENATPDDVDTAVNLAVEGKLE